MPEHEGIPAADRPAVEALSEVSEAIGRGVEAVRALEIDATIQDVVQAVVRTVVPSIIDEHRAEQAQAQQLMADANEALKTLARERDRARECWSRSADQVDRITRIATQRGQVAQRLRGELAVAGIDAERWRRLSVQQCPLGVHAEFFVDTDVAVRCPWCVIAELQAPQVSGVLAELAAERARQERKWGQQNHPDLMPGTDLGATQQSYADAADAWKAINAERVREANAEGVPPDRNAAWDGILLEEVYEALAEAAPSRIRAELIQVGAVAAAWVEAIDRRGAVTR